MDLLQLLRDEGLKVTEVGGWRTRGRPGGFAPIGVMIHHTASTNSLKVIRDGRSDLPGPLAQLHFPKDGTVNLVAAGRANHAGAGSSTVLIEAKKDIAPSGTAAARRLRDDTSGNGDWYGFECENLGNGQDPWPDVQLLAMAKASAALCRYHKWTPNRVVGHLEWTSRKIDPRGFSMSGFRNRVANNMFKGVKPMFDPPLPVAAWTLVPGGLVAAGPDGSVFCEPPTLYKGGANGQAYFAGRKVAQVRPRLYADGSYLGYTLVATSGETYNYP